MAINYIIPEKVIEHISVRRSVQTLLYVFLLMIISNFSFAQSKSIETNYKGLAKMNSFAQINEAILRTTTALNIVKSTAKNQVALDGQYTIGLAGTYPTITAAIADFNSAAITGPVLFSLLDATYPNETFPLIINANAGSSATNKLTIKPANGVTTTITGNATSLLKIDGADYITIDGSNNGTTSDNLIFNNINSNLSLNPVIVWIASTATDGANYVTIKNIKFLGSSPNETIVGLIISGPILGEVGSVPNNYVIVESNTFNRSQNAIFAIGINTAPDIGGLFTENTIGSTDPLEKMGFRGIAIQNANDFVISKNTISGVTIASSSIASGILIGSVINNAKIIQNKINDISNTNPAGFGANGIFSNVFVGNGNVLIANNFVSNVTGNGFPRNNIDDNGYGIVIGNAGTNIKIYHNTVSLRTNQQFTGKPAALNILNSVVTAAIDLRNNILVNSQTTIGDKYAIYSDASSTVFSNMDYNNYFSSGQNLSYYLTAAQPNLAALKTAFGGNIKSLNISPIFSSTADLHLTAANTSLANLGIALAEVTVDIDEEIRSTTAPNMGADEFTNTLSAKSFTNSIINFYPNPVIDYININHANDIESIEIYNVLGQKIPNSTWNAASGLLDMSNLTSGVYIVKLQSASEVQSIKVIKK
ncbi:hypothetical protein RCH18_002409 [Flavobacterium sp. PL11]|uniref:T9SS type A sorting domain-containing protein n=1 Tax=Flavobacterium sp. PL11 TaxID=3071717 RepID=UPI002E0A0668|nr:hypothetical protein [Flavobacterium sp. PL11]